MDKQIIQRSMLEVQKELADIDQQLEGLKELMARRNRLILFLENAGAILGIRPVGNSSEHESEIDVNSQPLWASVSAILARNKRPMTVPQIAAALHKAGWPKRDHSNEGVRTSMIRRNDVFERAGTGTYVLKAWPADWKKIVESGKAA